MPVHECPDESSSEERVREASATEESIRAPHPPNQDLEQSSPQSTSLLLSPNEVDHGDYGFDGAKSSTTVRRHQHRAPEECHSLALFASALDLADYGYADIRAQRLIVLEPMTHLKRLFSTTQQKRRRTSSAHICSKVGTVWRPGGH